MHTDLLAKLSLNYHRAFFHSCGSTDNYVLRHRHTYQSRPQSTSRASLCGYSLVQLNQRVYRPCLYRLRLIYFGYRSFHSHQTIIVFVLLLSHLMSFRLLS